MGDAKRRSIAQTARAATDIAGAPPMSGEQMRAARHTLGWTQAELGAALRLSGNHEHRKTRINDFEEGRKAITGPISVAVEAFVAGFVLQRTE